MAQVTVTIDGKTYRMACDDGQEEHLEALGQELGDTIELLRGKFGEIGDQRLEVMAALTIADELVDASARVRSLEEELDALRDVRVASAERTRTMQVAVAAALNSAAERIEKASQTLNRTVGKGIAIG